eukprot:11423697-Heterocapsa_arctica.AAC.1
MWERDLWRSLPLGVRAAVTPTLIALAILVDACAYVLAWCRLPAVYSVRGGWAAAAAATTASYDAPPA